MSFVSEPFPCLNGHLGIKVNVTRHARFYCLRKDVRLWLVSFLLLLSPGCDGKERQVATILAALDPDSLYSLRNESHFKGNSPIFDIKLGSNSKLIEDKNDAHYSMTGGHESVTTSTQLEKMHDGAAVLNKDRDKFQVTKLDSDLTRSKSKNTTRTLTSSLPLDKSSFLDVSKYNVKDVQSEMKNNADAMMKKEERGLESAAAVIDKQHDFDDTHAQNVAGHQRVQFLSASLSSSMPPRSSTRKEIFISNLRSKIIREFENSKLNWSSFGSGNMSREEYVGVYKEYFEKMKESKRASRKFVGARNRQKHAKRMLFSLPMFATDSVDNKTRMHFQIDLKNLWPFSIRVRRVNLMLPTNSCRLYEDESDETNGLDGSGRLMKDLITHIQRTSSRFSLFNVTVQCDSKTEDVEAVLSKGVLKVALDALLYDEQDEKEPADISHREIVHSRQKRRATWLSKLKKPIECRTIVVSKKRKHRCCREKLQVKFEELKLDIKLFNGPREFDAHICQGRCKSRQNRFFNFHASLQRYLSRIRGVVPRPCCVPTKYASIKILGTFNKSPRILTIEDAIVEECSCL